MWWWGQFPTRGVQSARTWFSFRPCRGELLTAIDWLLVIDHPKTPDSSSSSSSSSSIPASQSLEILQRDRSEREREMSCLLSCCASLTCGCCTSIASGITKKSARIAYCGLFGASLVLSWILREVAAPLLQKFPCNYHSIHLFSSLISSGHLLFSFSLT